jgi:hypothetical protein
MAADANQLQGNPPRTKGLFPAMLRAFKRLLDRFSVAERNVASGAPAQCVGKSYIFIIGFNKTGTVSLHEFFQENGFSSVQWDDGRLARTMIVNLLEGRAAFHGYDDKFQVFSDFNWTNYSIDVCGNKFYRALDRDYPGSFFIYNHRPLQKWAFRIEA